jgi:hypothetical protein
MCLLQKHMVGQQANGYVQEVISSTTTVYFQKESSLEVHCLSRHPTVHASRNTPSGIILAFSTIPPLRQLPLAEKAGSPWNAFQEPDSWVPSRLR